jgi:hypothetical protein
MNGKEGKVTRRFLAAAIVTLVVVSAGAPSAMADGWMTYWNGGSVGRLGLKYSGYGAGKAAAAAEAASYNWGCADLEDPTTGWLWYPMSCTTAGNSVGTPYTSPGYYQAVTWNDSNSTQAMWGWYYWVCCPV